MVEDLTPGNHADTNADVSSDSGWVSTKVAAEALGVNPRTVRAYIERGDLEARAEGKGVEKAYRVSIDSIYALRERRGVPRKTRSKTRGKSASAEVSAEDLTGTIRDLTAELIQKSTEAAELRIRLELTEKTESTLREENERLWTELETERSKGLWRRLFGV
jgi:DNA-binding transcriptional MerR regulator